jgi:hypothetical protein
MAYERFIETVEAKKLLQERDKYLIFGDHCTREYEGEIKKRGDQIRIRGLGTPTIYQLTKDGSYAANAVGAGSFSGKGKDVVHKGIPTAEEIGDSEILLKVDQIALFNYMIGDIDKELTSKYGLMEKYRQKTAREMADVQDKYIAKMITGFAGSENTGTSYYTPGTGARLTAGAAAADASSNQHYNILDFIDEQVEGFNVENIGDDVKVVGECTPKFWRYLKKALRTIDTDNSKLIKGREVTEYNGIPFFKTNNAKVGSNEYVIIRTVDSVAFFDPLMHIEPYRLQEGFADALKGFNLFDAGIVEPKAIKWSKILSYLG